MLVLQKHFTKRFLLASLVTSVLFLVVFVFLVHIADAQDPRNVDDNETNMFLRYFWYLATAIGGIVIRTGGYLLDTSIQSLVIGMGALMGGSIGVTVNSVWVVIRDTFNLVFIFALIYIGLRLIWDSSDGSAKSNLARLIVAALLINFSLFFAKVIVDMGNITAIQIYSLYGNVQAETSVSLATAQSEGIAAYVLHHFGLGSIGSAAPIETPGNISVGFALIVMIFLIVTGFVFAAGAIMLVGRFVLLTLYMMFAPFMFIGWIIPKFGSYQSQWWGGFLKQVFVAPAFLFTTYIALRIITVAQGQPGFEGEFVSELAGNSNTGGGTLIIVVGIGFMIMALVLANKMGAVGAATSIKIGQNIRQRGQRFAGAATAGMAARVGRNSVGLGAQAIADSDWAKRSANKFGRTGRTLYQATQKVADSSFDARQVAGVGTAMGVGTGKKGGYSSRLKEEKKLDEQFLKDTATKLSPEEVRKRTEVAKSQDENYHNILREKADAETEVIKLQQQRTEKNLDFTADEAEIEKLKRKLAVANPINAGEINKDIATKSAALEQKKQDNAAAIANIESQIKTAEAKVQKADSALNEAENSVRAKVEHANQLAYIKAMESTARWQKKVALGVGMAGAATMAVLAAPVAGAGLLGAATYAGAIGAGAATGVAATGSGGAYRKRQRHEELVDEYGKDKSGNVDGSKKKKSEGERKRLKALAEEVAKADDGGSKKDDAKDDSAAK